jgi:hypothetical protein
MKIGGQSSLGIDSNIVPLSSDGAKKFTRGEAICMNRIRAMARSIRKGIESTLAMTRSLKKDHYEHRSPPMKLFRSLGYPLLNF